MTQVSVAAHALDYCESEFTHRWVARLPGGYCGGREWARTAVSASSGGLGATRALLEKGRQRAAHLRRLLLTWVKVDPGEAPRQRVEGEECPGVGRTEKQRAGVTGQEKSDAQKKRPPGGGLLGEPYPREGG